MLSGSEYRIRAASARLDQVWQWVERGTDVVRKITADPDLDLDPSTHRLAQAVGEVKKIDGSPVFRPDRELQVIEGLKQRNILVDGTPGELLLQIFSENQLGPIFFEFIQRKGNEGFGEGNFKALFETIELDQVRRGVLQA